MGMLRARSRAKAGDVAGEHEEWEPQFPPPLMFIQPFCGIPSWALQALLGRESLRQGVNPVGLQQGSPILLGMGRIRPGSAALGRAQPSHSEGGLPKFHLHVMGES